MYLICHLGITRVQNKRLGIVAHRVLEIARVAPFGVARLYGLGVGSLGFRVEEEFRS